MRVILLQDIDALGRVGDIKQVTDGYARNFLFPRGLAKLATPETIRKTEKRKEEESAAQDKKLGGLREIAKKIETMSFSTQLRQSETGKSFGSVTPLKIVTFLKEQGVEIEKSQVDLKESLKEPGTHKVNIKLAPEVSASLSVTINPTE